MPKRGSTETTVAAPPHDVFAFITDLDRLPEWNTIMTGVVERPAELAPGAEWVVRFHALGRSWNSRSRVEEIDRSRRVFQYRSGTDDGNPSYTVWRWQVDPDGDGSRVTVGWELRPKTFWRRALIVHVRNRQLRSEAPASLAALGRHVGSPS
ncbi:MAG: SRPBCC family protein [Acidimicrobiia bacterium]